MKINRNKLEKNQIFIYLLIIIIGLTGLKIKYGYRGEKTEEKPNSIQQPIAEPTIAPTVTTIPTKTEEKEYPLFKLLPYSGKGFVLEKYVAPRTLRMILNGATETGATKDAKAWLRSQGKAGEDHKILLQIDN